MRNNGRDICPHRTSVSGSLLVPERHSRSEHAWPEGEINYFLKSHAVLFTKPYSGANKRPA
jgi:hypothetical protein